MQENYFNLMDYIDKAGIIGYLLLLLFTIGVTLMIWKFVHIFYCKSTREKYLQYVLEEVKFIEEASLSMKVSKSIIDEKMSNLESGMSTIRIVASISPLLGLLGTVIGILQAFDVISKIGLGEPTAFAAGISLALITTVMGLIISIPHYVGYNYLVRSINHFESVLLKEIDFKILKK
ncbi:MAG: MotA/TolQ/ExbB proton channel family protein [Aliarcobacter sp.]|jgi:biopolymer transport protein ExbB|nr:MotA/TolQ/ExbB proton channel family protein [Aliarcobacter sp.]